MLENDIDNYGYLRIINEQLTYVASPAIRDVATFSGNLMVKHQYKEEMEVGKI